MHWHVAFGFLLRRSNSRTRSLTAPQDINGSQSRNGRRCEHRESTADTPSSQEPFLSDRMKWALVFPLFRRSATAVVLADQIRHVAWRRFVRSDQAFNERSANAAEFSCPASGQTYCWPGRRIQGVVAQRPDRPSRRIEELADRLRQLRNVESE